MLRRLLYALPACVLVISVSRADVTFRYQTTVEPGGALPPQAKQSMQAASQASAPQTVRIKNRKMSTRTSRFSTIFDADTQNVTIIDHQNGTASTMPASAWTDEFAKAIPKPAVGAVPQMKTEFDSRKTGRRETIQGIPAEEREATFTIRGDGAVPQAMSMKMSLRLWGATEEAAVQNPAVSEFTGFRFSAGSILNPLHSLNSVFDAVPGLGSGMTAMLRDLSAAGGPMLRTDVALYVTMPPEVIEKMRLAGSLPANFDPGAPMMKMRTEVAELSTAPVDDAFFAIPDGYRTVGAAEIVAAMTKPPGPPQPSQSALPKPEIPKGVYRVGGGVSAPQLTYKAEPTYTEAARKAHLSGAVVLFLVVGTDGVPRDMKVVKSLGLGLDEKAMEAVSHWRFRPGQKDGEPVPVAAQIEVNFRLLDRPPQP